MKIQKIKAVKHNFDDGFGPWNTITLGFMVDDKSFILGSFYNGPSGDQKAYDEMILIESIIDLIVAGGAK